MREYGKEIENLKHILQKFKTNEIKSCLYFTHDTKPIYMFSETAFKQHEAEIRKPFEEEIERLKKQLDLNDKEHFRNALKQLRENDYDTIRKAERQKVIAEMEEWANTCHLVESIYEGIYCIDKDDLKQKLNEMKGEKREGNS